MRKLYGLIECCLNWRVIAGLALIGSVLFVYEPKLAVSSLPVLVALVCPISMLFMMLSMQRMNMGGRSNAESAPEPGFRNLSRENQLQFLEDQLERVQEQQRAISGQLPALERSQTQSDVAVAAHVNGKVESEATVS